MTATERSSLTGITRRGRYTSALVLAVAALVGGCDSKNVYIPPPPSTVTVARPLRQPATLYFELTGNTAPVKMVDLEARVQGFLESIDYVDGATVKSGTQLFGIQRNTYEAQLAQASATLQADRATQANADTNYHRQLYLAKDDFASQATLDNAKTQFDTAVAATLGAEAALEQAKINLGYTKVVAPFDGAVTHHLVNVGALVGVSGPTQLATIVQTNPLFVYFNVSESQVLQIKRLLVGEGRTVEQLDLSMIPIEIGLAGENGYSHTGHLDYIAPQVDASTGTLLVRGIVENESQLLLPGLFVRVRVPTRKLSAATLVQDDAIGTDQRGNYVLVVGDDDVVVQKYVKTGPRQGNLRIIDAGLGPNDWVVSAGVELAVPGSKVAPERTVLAPSLVGAGSSPGLKAQ